MSLPRASLGCAALVILIGIGYSLLAKSPARHPEGQVQPPQLEVAAPRDAVGERLLLVGVDGLEWSLVLPLLEDGELPGLRRLMRDGTFGYLSTIEPTLSPVIWTTVATGKEPEKHGILGFEHPSDQKQLYSNSDRTTKAFWNILSDHGKQVAVVGWFLTFPVEPINGVMVAQTNTGTLKAIRQGKDIVKGTLIRDVPGQVYPPEQTELVMRLLDQAHRRVPQLMREVFGLESPGSQMFASCEWALRADATYLSIAQELSSKQEFDLIAIYLGGTDVASHRFWKGARSNDRRAVIPAYYRYIDRAVTRLQNEVGIENILLISDHGFAEGRHDHAEPGVLIASGPAFRDGAEPVENIQTEDLPTIGSVVDVTPTLLAFFGIPVGEDMDGRVLDTIYSRPSSDHRASVPTHDTKEWLAARPEATMPQPQIDERLQQLRALGYIE